MDVEVTRRGRRTGWRTALYVALAVLASLTSVAYSEMGRQGEHGWQIMLVLLLFLLSFAVPLLLVWRHRYPYAVPLVAAAVAAILPIGSWTALIALASLVARRRDRQVWGVALAVLAATAVSMVRDVQGTTMETSLLRAFLGPTNAPRTAPVELSPWAVPLAVLLLCGLAVGLGLLVRAHRDARASESAVEAEREVAGRLGDELARQQERQRIAREVHDVLGHRLSLLTLHAGALEANARGNPELEQSARLVRESAARAMDDLRSLLAVLREPLEPSPADPDLSLVDLRDVIDDAVRTGGPVTSTVYLDSPEQADPQLSRAVYRIVQEVLTNARKHAPGLPVRLEVSGGPGRGVRIDAHNPYVPGEHRPDGHGLTGMAERVELLGGTLRYGLDDSGRTFRVTAELPWG